MLTLYGVTVKGRPLTDILEEVRNFVKDHSDKDYDSGSEDYDSGNEDDDDYGASAPRGRQSLADRSANGKHLCVSSRGSSLLECFPLASITPRDVLLGSDCLCMPSSLVEQMSRNECFWFVKTRFQTFKTKLKKKKELEPALQNMRQNHGCE